MISPGARLAKAIGQSIDENELAVVERGQHAQAIHADPGGYGVDDEEEYDRQGDGFEEIKKAALPR